MYLGFSCISAPMWSGPCRRHTDTDRHFSPFIFFRERKSPFWSKWMMHTCDTGGWVVVQWLAVGLIPRNDPHGGPLVRESTLVMGASAWMCVCDSRHVSPPASLSPSAHGYDNKAKWMLRSLRYTWHLKLNLHVLLFIPTPPAWTDGVSKIQHFTLLVPVTFSRWWDG